uniref:Fucosyltransferase n=1 Tax=Panagrellus redivivus TaxID=6233 RepID=A0A7E4UM14_PANRE
MFHPSSAARLIITFVAICLFATAVLHSSSNRNPAVFVDKLLSSGYSDDSNSNPKSANIPNELPNKLKHNFEIDFVYDPLANFSYIPTPADAPLLLGWNKYASRSVFNNLDTVKRICPLKCRYTEDKRKEAEASVVVFHLGVDGIDKFPKPRMNKTTIFLNLESPAHRPVPKTFPSDYFNFTMTYRLDSDFVLPYGHLEELEGPDDSDRWSVENVDAAIKKKKLTALIFVSHCETESKRENVIKELSTYINVTNYGRCSKKKCPRNTDCEMDEIKNHYFYLAFENSICIDYITEKFFRFRNLIVPIVLDRSIFRGAHAALNPYFIAVSDFTSIQALAEHLQFLIDTPAEYRKYFSWTDLYKKNFQGAFPPESTCIMCELAWRTKLGHRHSFKGIHSWWNDNQCKVVLNSS